MLTKHITQAASDEIFTEEELAKLTESLKLDRNSLQLVILSISHLLKQSSKVILKPTVLQEQLTECLKLDPDKAEEFVKLWTQQTNTQFDLQNSKNLENISWELNVQTASNLYNKQQKISTRLQLALANIEGQEKETVTLELDEEELKKLYGIIGMYKKNWTIYNLIST